MSVAFSKVIRSPPNIEPGWVKAAELGALVAYSAAPTMGANNQLLKFVVFGSGAASELRRGEKPLRPLTVKKTSFLTLLPWRPQKMGESPAMNF